MASVASRSRANERVNRISVNLDRSSGYLLGNIPNAVPTSASLRRTRESSLGALGRSNLDSGTSSVRMRESSLTRGGRPSAADNARNSAMIPSNFETAKYNREQEMKDIHSNFMKQYNTTKSSLNNDEPVEKERKSKAYQRIVNNEPPRYLDEREAKKACVSDMFMDTSKFSTKTLSAINGLEGAVLRKKDKEYNWRKEMDDYEKRADFDRDVRARNVTALHREDQGEDHWASQRKTEDRKRQGKGVTEKPIEKVAKKENDNKESETVKSWREKREAERAVEKTEPEPERKSWREKLVEKQKQEDEEKKEKEADAVAAAAFAAQATKKASAAAAEASPADATTKSAEATADGENAEEEEDLNGTKKLKSDISCMFSGLEQEFEAGREKMAKLKERIKKAKTAIKEADDGDTEESKESEEEKDKRRNALREKFRLQREAKKKAAAEQQK